MGEQGCAKCTFVINNLKPLGLLRSTAGAGILRQKCERCQFLFGELARLDRSLQMDVLPTRAQCLAAVPFSGFDTTAARPSSSRMSNDMIIASIADPSDSPFAIASTSSDTILTLKGKPTGSCRRCTEVIRSLSMLASQSHSSAKRIPCFRCEALHMELIAHCDMLRPNSKVRVQCTLNTEVREIPDNSDWIAPIRENRVHCTLNTEVRDIPDNSDWIPIRENRK